MLVEQNFTLSSGQESGYFFDCKRVTLNGQSLLLVAEEFLHRIDTLSPLPKVISGLTMGADAIASAVALRAAQLGHPTFTAAIVRKQVKPHGTQNAIENAPAAGTQVVVIDDVITSGRSTQIACEALIQAGCSISGILCLVDRQEGGVDTLRERYQCCVEGIYCRSDFSGI